MCSILMIVCVSGGSEETAHCLFAFDIGIAALHLVRLFGYTIRLSLVLIEGNLKANLYTSDILPPMFVYFLRCLPNTIFQQDDVRPNVAIFSLGNVNRLFFFINLCQY